MKEDHWEDKQSSDSALPLPHRTNPTGGAIRPQMTTGQTQQSPTISFDTGKSKKSQKKEKQKETEFPALFCDNGDCTLGQSHTGVACVWNSCVSTTGEAMAAEMCEGENCHNTTGLQIFQCAHTLYFIKFLRKCHQSNARSAKVEPA